MDNQNQDVELPEMEHQSEETTQEMINDVVEEKIEETKAEEAPKAAVEEEKKQICPAVNSIVYFIDFQNLN